MSLISLNGCFSVSKSMSVTDRQTDRATTRGPIGPKNMHTLFIYENHDITIAMSSSRAHNTGFGDAARYLEKQLW